jgi:hypothetical protein
MAVSHSIRIDKESANKFSSSSSSSSSWERHERGKKHRQHGHAEGIIEGDLELYALFTPPKLQAGYTDGRNTAADMTAIGQATKQQEVVQAKSGYRTKMAAAKALNIERSSRSYKDKKGNFNGSGTISLWCMIALPRSRGSGCENGTSFVSADALFAASRG